MLTPEISQSTSFENPETRYYALGFRASPEVMAEDHSEAIIRDAVERIVRSLFFTYVKGMDGVVKFRIEMTCPDLSHDHKSAP